MPYMDTHIRHTLCIIIKDKSTNNIPNNNNNNNIVNCYNVNSQKTTTKRHPLLEILASLFSKRKILEVYSFSFPCYWIICVTKKQYQPSKKQWS